MMETDGYLVLVVEDDPNIREILHDIIAEVQGACFVGASDGVEAIHLAWERRPQLILLDLNLPKLGGREVARRLRADPSTRAIPIVIVSASLTRPIAAELAQLGCELLPKPFDVKAVLEIIDNHRAGGMSNLLLGRGEGGNFLRVTALGKVSDPKVPAKAAAHRGG